MNVKSNLRKLTNIRKDLSKVIKKHDIKSIAQMRLIFEEILLSNAICKDISTKQRAKELGIGKTTYYRMLEKYGFKEDKDNGET